MRNMVPRSPRRMPGTHPNNARTAPGAEIGCHTGIRNPIGRLYGSLVGKLIWDFVDVFIENRLTRLIEEVINLAAGGIIAIRAMQAYGKWRSKGIHAREIAVISPVSAGMFLPIPNSVAGARRVGWGAGL